MVEMAQNIYFRPYFRFKTMFLRMANSGDDSIDDGDDDDILTCEMMMMMVMMVMMIMMTKHIDRHNTPDIIQNS